MHSTREPLDCGALFAPVDPDAPLQTTALSAASTVGPATSLDSGSVTATLTEPSGAKRVWTLTGPGAIVKKEVGTSIAQVSMGTPTFAATNEFFPQASCYMRPDERLVLCADMRLEASTKKSLAHRKKLPKDHTTVQPIDLFSEKGETAEPFARGTITFLPQEHILGMAYIPHHTETLVHADNLQKSFQFGCHVVVFLTSTGRFFLWKISDAGMPANAKAAVPDSLECVWSLTETLGEKAIALAMTQLSHDALLVLSTGHCTRLTVSPDFSIQLETAPMEAQPMPQTPFSFFALSPRDQPTLTKSKSIADFAFVSEKNSEAKKATLCVGSISENLKENFIQIEISLEDSQIIGVFPLQPFAVTQRFAFATLSALTVYCCRFGLQEIFRLGLESAAAAVWLPHKFNERHALCVFTRKAQLHKRRLNAALMADFVTLRDDEAAQAGGRTSLAAFLRRRKPLPAEEVKAKPDAAAVAALPAFTEMKKAYDEVKESLQRFPHTLAEWKAKNASQGSWECVTEKFAALEAVLRAFCHDHGHLVWDIAADDNDVTKLLKSIRSISKYIKTHATHTEIFAKKRTVLRPPKREFEAFMAGEVAAQQVVLDGKYPRRTVDSADYGPGPLRPPHMRSG